MCFTFTVQIMHRIPILMSYFGDHYARLLEGGGHLMKGNDEIIAKALDTFIERTK